MARSTRLCVSNVEGKCSGSSGNPQVLPRSAGETKLIHDRSVLQRNGDCIIRDRHGVVGNLEKPEKAIRSDSGIEIVQLGRQTDVPKVQSYENERAMPFGGCSSSADVGWDTANVIALIDADVSDHRVLVALAIRGGAEGISHGHMALEIRDDIGFCVLAIEKRPDTGRVHVPQCV